MCMQNSLWIHINSLYYILIPVWIHTVGLRADERFLEGDNIGSISHTTRTNAHNKLLCHENLCKEAPCADLVLVLMPEEASRSAVIESEECWRLLLTMWFSTLLPCRISLHCLPLCGWVVTAKCFPFSTTTPLTAGHWISRPMSCNSGKLLQHYVQFQ